MGTFFLWYESGGGGFGIGGKPPPLRQCNWNSHWNTFEVLLHGNTEGNTHTHRHTKKKTQKKNLFKFNFGYKLKIIKLN